MVARLPIRLCDGDGKRLTRPSPTATMGPEESRGKKEEGRRKKEIEGTLAPLPTSSISPLPASLSPCEVPILVGGEVAGRIVLDPSPAAAQPSAGGDAATRVLRYFGLMANVISRLCDREQQLRTRMEELAALYSLTAEFTSRRDLTSLLNQVAKTVVEVLKAKACSIRLLTEDHKELVIKAVHNMSSEYLNKGPILVAGSQIDEEVLHTRKPVYIADQRSDPRVMYPKEAKREGIVSALVAPLIYKGRPEGVIRVYTGKKHEFDWFEQSLLVAIAGEAAAAIVNARLYEDAVHLANMRKAMAMAGEVQRRMIPERAPSVPGFQIAAMLVPSYEVGGDFYDFLNLNDSLGIAICDVAGKGVRASLLMASIRASLRAHASSIYEMADVIARVNHDLCEDVLTSDFATLFYGVLHPASRRFTYVNAGHPAPLLFRGGQVCSLGAGGVVIGIEPDAGYPQESFFLQSGDLLLMFTDGLFEAMNFADEPFGRQRIDKAVLAAMAQGQSAEGILRHLVWEMRRFAGLQSRFDDLTLLAIRVE